MKTHKLESLKTSIKLSESLGHELSQRVIADNFGMHGKSKWIVQAVESFLKHPNFPDLVELACDMEDQGKTISMSLPQHLVMQIDNAVIDVRKLFPQMEGVRSHIIRASIIQKLLT